MLTSLSNSDPIRRTPTPVTDPVKCASWCEEGGGHMGALFAEDQWCQSVQMTTAVSLHPPHETLDGGELPPEAVVYARQDVGAPSYVTLVNQDDKGMNLTPDEARHLATLLRHFAWVAEQDGEKRNAFEIGREIGQECVTGAS